MSAALVQLKGVTKTYTRGKQKVEVLKALDLDVAQGDFLALMGPSGSGKTTLLSILGCILSPTEGHIEVAGNSTLGQDAEGLANIRRRHVGQDTPGS